MPLNWDLTKIKDNETVCWLPEDKGMNPATNVIIMFTMVAGIGKITEDTADEFYRRFNLYQRNFGALLHSEKSEHFLTLADIKQHIGLMTNVSLESKAKWNNRFRMMLYDQAERNASND